MHPTKASLGTANTNWHMAEWKAEELSTQSGVPNPFACIPSVVCQRAIKGKHTKYSLLVAMANAQKAEGVRDKRVKFLACVATHFGEFSPGFFELIERLVAIFASNPAHAPSVTGVTKSYAVAAFRETCSRRLKASDPSPSSSLPWLLHIWVN